MPSLVHGPGCMGPTKEEANKRADMIFDELMVTLKKKYRLERPTDYLHENIVKGWDAEVARLKEVIRDMVFTDDCANF